MNDEWGNGPQLNKDGDPEPGFWDKGEWVPLVSHVISKPGEFTIHDESQGHCGLCGSIRCRGNCFK